MRIPLGGKQSNDGFYGGVGSKPAPKTWMPATQKEERPAEKVPRKFRGLRLRRTRRSKMEPTPDYVAIPVAAVVIGLLFLLALLVLG